MDYTISWSDKTHLQNLFDIDGVAFDSYRIIPKEMRIKFLCKFKKNYITLDEFDNFCSASSGHLGVEMKKDILSIFNITCPIGFYIDKNRFVRERENNVSFTRDIKLKLLLCQ